MKKNTIKIDTEQSKKMLNHQKEVLLKVSDCCRSIFEKELEKSKLWLLPVHIKELVRWVWGAFSRKYSDIRELLHRLFDDVVDDVASLFSVSPSFTVS